MGSLSDGIYCTTHLFPAQVVRGGHRKGRMARHTCCVDDTWFVSLEEEDMEKTLGKKGLRCL